ncbi:hypothetical protein [Pediococcus acidilactici]|uniref:hypothetical protein n=1 Tax=Pediococcus acidilactici TaxID=1254 RepID=UPI002AFEA29B|nr:hypothetical protein [Pediococcus acidilactici]WQS10527.1 hypothetical protein SGW13_07210 [Pediococcus acidilactici]WQS11450.1 hypothetical protein SGW13_01435 [Pediococcus acidilactici]
MKYEYENKNELREISTEIAILVMKFNVAFSNNDSKMQEEALHDLKNIEKRVEDFKPIIKINVED